MAEHVSSEESSHARIATLNSPFEGTIKIANLISSLSNVYWCEPLIALVNTMPEKRASLNHVKVLLAEESTSLSQQKDMSKPNQGVLATSVKKTKPCQRYAPAGITIRCFRCNEMKNVMRECKSPPTDRRKKDSSEEKEWPKSSQLSNFGSKSGGKHRDSNS